MKKEWIIQIIGALLIILWIYAAGSKLANYNIFAYQLARQPLPSWSIPIIQWLLPAFEIFTVVLLCFHGTLSRGFLLSFILMAVFTLYVGFGLAHVYNKVPCSCGGILNHASWGTHLIFNIFFTILSFTGWWLLKQDLRKDNNKHQKNSNINLINQ